MSLARTLTLVPLLGLPLACSSAIDLPPPGPGLGDADDSTGSATEAAPSDTDPTDGSVDTTVDTTVGDSSPSTSDADSTATEADPTDTDTETGPTESPLRRYSLNLATGQWTSVILDEVWTDPQAPPTGGILATASMTHFNRLLVLADDGNTYQQVQGMWLEPVVTEDHFAMLAGRTVDAISHTPNPQDPTIETLFLIADHHAVLYDLSQSGSVSFVDDIPLIDEPDGPPHASGRPRWAFTRSNPADFGQLDWLEWFYLYDDDVLYRSNANAEWADQWDVLNNPFFTGAAGEPDPRMASATWYDDDLARLNVLAP